MTDPNAPQRAYLPWVRQGLVGALPEVDTGGGTSTPRAPVRVWVNEPEHVDPSRSVPVPLALYGPGDVAGLDPAQVVRTYPPHLSGDAEMATFPLIDFDRPDLPWLFTPRRATAQQRLRPWLVLVVTSQADSGIGSIPGAPLPVLDCSVAELPDLAESWAWAHAQVVRPDDSVSLANTFTGAPERTLSRLLCPRKLTEGTPYRACVVPAFAVGRLRGLGGRPDPDAPLEPAWPMAGDGPRAKLPVYYYWEFTTGSAGSFETLARRLSYRDLPVEVGGRGVDIGHPGWGLTGMPARTVDLPAALSVPRAERRPWPEPERAVFSTALAQALASGPDAADVRPPVYGATAAQVPDPSKDAPLWLSELNLDPRKRIAAGAGALVVQMQQEQLIAEAWTQLPAELAAVRRSREEMAAEVRRSVTDRHLLALGTARFLQITEPLQRRSLRSDALAAAVPAAVSAPQLSARYARLARRTGSAAVAEMETLVGSPSGLSLLHGRTRMLTSRSTDGAVHTERRAVGGADAAITGSPDGPRFTPRYTAPGYELLRDYAPDLLLPGLSEVPVNSVSLLKADPAFIEAFLIGMNSELGRELAWRRYPADPRGTFFTQFWSRGGPGQAEPEITDLRSWDPASGLGEHVGEELAGMLVLMVRGDLLRRFPRTSVHAAEAVWKAGARAVGSLTRAPVFTARSGLDISMFGFALSQDEARGSTDPAQHPGWWFVLSEPAQEARFGLDESTSVGGTPAVWADLSWGHLAGDSAGLDAITHVPLGGPLAGLQLEGLLWGADAAATAMITEQQPFQVVVHASHWLP